MSPKSSPEYIHHCCAVRLRVVGIGNFRMKLLSYDAVKTKTLTNLIMSAATDRELTKVTNFKSQRMQLEFKITDANESFTLGRVVLFMKPVATSYPG